MVVFDILTLLCIASAAPNIMNDVDFSNVEGKLAGLSKQQLLDFVRKTGDWAKNE